MLTFKGYCNYVFSFLPFTSVPRTWKQRGERKKEKKGKKKQKVKTMFKGSLNLWNFLPPEKNSKWIKFNEMILIIAMIYWVFIIPCPWGENSCYTEYALFSYVHSTVPCTQECPVSNNIQPGAHMEKQRGWRLVIDSLKVNSVFGGEGATSSKELLPFLSFSWLTASLNHFTVPLTRGHKEIASFCCGLINLISKHGVLYLHSKSILPPAGPSLSWRRDSLWEPLAIIL